MLNDVNEASLFAGYNTDHSLIYFNIQFGKFKKGKSLWKFNNSLLRDKVYINEMKQVIKEVKLQYASENQIHNLPLDEIPIQDLQLTINDQLFFEVLIMAIRGKTISYATYAKRKEDKTEKNLLEDIQKLEQELDTQHEELESKRKQLEDIRKKKLEGIKIRSRAQWVDEGEKVTSYFL